MVPLSWNQIPAHVWEADALYNRWLLHLIVLFLLCSFILSHAADVSFRFHWMDIRHVVEIISTSIKYALHCEIINPLSSVSRFWICDSEPPWKVKEIMLLNRIHNFFVYYLEQWFVNTIACQVQKIQFCNVTARGESNFYLITEVLLAVEATLYLWYHSCKLFRPLPNINISVYYCEFFILYLACNLW